MWFLLLETFSWGPHSSLPWGDPQLMPMRAKGSNQPWRGHQSLLTCFTTSPTRAGKGNGHVGQQQAAAFALTKRSHKCIPFLCPERIKSNSFLVKAKCFLICSGRGGGVKALTGIFPCPPSCRKCGPVPESSTAQSKGCVLLCFLLSISVSFTQQSSEKALLWAARATCRRLQRMWGTRSLKGC